MVEGQPGGKINHAQLATDLTRGVELVEFTPPQIEYLNSVFHLKVAGDMGIIVGNGQNGRLSGGTLGQTSSVKRINSRLAKEDVTSGESTKSGQATDSLVWQSASVRMDRWGLLQKGLEPLLGKGKGFLVLSEEVQDLYLAHCMIEAEEQVAAFERSGLLERVIKETIPEEAARAGLEITSMVGIAPDQLERAQPLYGENSFICEEPL